MVIPTGNVHVIWVSFVGKKQLTRKTRENRYGRGLLFYFIPTNHGSIVVVEGPCNITAVSSEDSNETPPKGARKFQEIGIQHTPWSGSGETWIRKAVVRVIFWDRMDIHGSHFVIRVVTPESIIIIIIIITWIIIYIHVTYDVLASSCYRPSLRFIITQ